MKTLITLVLIFVIGSVVFYYRDSIWNPETIPQTATTTPSESRAMSIEDYVKLNISDLSTQAGAEEVLGGKFYVTGITANNGSGTVNYEDGHNAYIADFTYTIEPNHGAVTINSFKVRK